MSYTETRAISLTDLPLLRRLGGNGAVLDSETALTSEAQTSLTSILFGRPFVTLVARTQERHAIGQFRYKADDLNAHITFISPAETPSPDDVTAWYHVLDGMAREAGKLGAHALIAEVEMTSDKLVLLRQARFACYARQTIWRRPAMRCVASEALLQLTEECGYDQIGISSLMVSTIPTLQQLVFMPHGDMEGLVWRKNGQVEAYLTYTEGKHGIYLVPYIHSDEMGNAELIIASAIARLPKAERLPVYVCVRSYQTWLESRLMGLGFEQVTEQSVMVRHIAAGIKEASFKQVRAKSKLEIATNGHPTWASYAQLKLEED
jgi:hypothetical protein